MKRYTFGVTRTEDNGLLENLLLKEQTDGTYKVYLVQYAITIEERSTLANQEIVDVDNKITYVPLEDISSSIFNKVNSDAETCTVYSYGWQQASTCGAGGNHTYQDGGYSATNPGGCHAWGNPDLMATSGGYVLTSNEQDCGSGSTSGYDPSNNNTNSNTTNSNGGGNYTPIPDTEVILCTDCPLIEDDCSATYALNNLETTLGLDAALVTCLSDEEKCGAVGELDMFVTNNSTPDDIEFAQIATYAICNENFKLEDLFQFYNGMTKKCQANKILKFYVYTNSFITNSIKNNFYGDNNADIEIKNINFDVNLDSNALTVPPVGMVFNQSTAVEIYYDNNYLENATDLSIIMTTSHEFIHAHLIHLFISGNLLNNYPNYVEVNEAFQTFTNTPNESTANTLNNEMHDVYNDFLPEIIDSVFKYANANNIEEATEEYCTKLVLGAHQNTTTFQNLTETQQIEYSTITVNENEGNENSKGETCN